MAAPAITIIYHTFITPLVVHPSLIAMADIGLELDPPVLIRVSIGWN